MKILYVVSTLANTGPTNQLYSLVRKLNRDVYSPSLLTLSPEPETNSAWSRFEGLEVEMGSLRLSRLEGLLLARSRVRELMEKIKPDIVHTQGIRADVLNVATMKGVPSLCTARNYPFSDYPSKFGKFRGSVMARQHVQALRKIHVVACSHAIATQLVPHGIAPDVVQNGVEAETFYPVDSARKAVLRSRLGLPQDALVLLSVGSLIPRKDMLTAVEAYQAARLGPNARLVVLGGGPLEGELRSLADETVVLKGHVDNIKDYLNAADVFVSSSLAEGLPNTVLEAMASGLPCILSDIPPHRELQEDDDAFFPCGDISALSSRLSAMADKDRTALGREARRHVEHRLSAERMVAEYQEIYRKVVEAQGGQ
ncbi:glycosyltransferase family 4 protein [Thioalkalivibrio sp. ALMg3]|uniref:glycosyltransferase family 4 protein n=1 Tax=Thioalkalivibrio sp. ALMg3 TaxID=1158163 RepID=UPI000374CCA6|nr:glycosyltransferase family 4 protein [Thioalkalivibrio sp. ALMg3]